MGLYTKIELRGLLRGDFKSQQEGFEVMRRNGVINAEEWRALVDMTPMPADVGGDKYVMQSQNTTLEQLGKEPPPPASPASAPAAPSHDEALAQSEIDRMAEEAADAEAAA
jgi:hypothetical protein